MSLSHSPQIVRNGLILCLDAANPRSYPGSGTDWNDLSGNGNNFTINSSAYSTSGGIPHMNFEGSFGMAKRIVGSSLSDIPSFSNATVMAFTTIKNSTAEWRTMLRGATANHPILIQSGGTNLGMYNNSVGSFLSSGYSITSLPNPYTKFNCLVFNLSTASPFYDFSFNNGTSSATITNSNASFTQGFASIGGNHEGSTNVNAGNQYWGKISCFLYYNRKLTQQEINQNYNALKGRYSL
jgi:hypothetical protein